MKDHEVPLVAAVSEVHFLVWILGRALRVFCTFIGRFISLTTTMQVACNRKMQVKRRGNARRVIFSSSLHPNYSIWRGQSYSINAPWQHKVSALLILLIQIYPDGEPASQ